MVANGSHACQEKNVIASSTDTWSGDDAYIILKSGYLQKLFITAFICLSSICSSQQSAKAPFSHILYQGVNLSWHFSLSSPQGPFVHVASMCAALLSKFMSLFGGIYEVSTVGDVLWIFIQFFTDKDRLWRRSAV